MNRNRQLKFGIVAFAASLVQIFLPNELVNPTFISLSWFLNWVGLILIGDHITQKLNGKSLRKTIHHSRSNSINFIIAGVLGGVLVEGVGQWLGKLWFYPYFSTPEYLFVAIPGFALYMLMIAECYLATKAIIDKILRPRKTSRKYFPLETKLYRSLPVIGPACFFLGTSILLADYKQGYAFRVNLPYNLNVTFVGVLLFACGVWWTSEYLEYRRRETSLLKDIFHAYWNPLIAIIIATAVVGISMELINLRHEYWVYANWPLQNDHVLGLPIIMITVAWPIHFVMFLSLFRAITAKDSAEVWRVPVVKRRAKRSPRALATS